MPFWCNFLRLKEKSGGKGESGQQIDLIKNDKSEKFVHLSNFLILVLGVICVKMTKYVN